MADPRRATLVVAVTAVALGLPLGFLTLLDTTLATERSERVPEVAEDELYLSGVGGLLTPPSAGVRRAVERAVGASGAQIGYLAGDSGASRVTAPALGSGFILTTDDVERAGTVLGRRLSSAESAALRDGGILAWDARPAAQRLAVTDGRELRVPAQPAPMPRLGWAQGTQGLMLTATARALDLPRSRGAIFYSGLPRDRIARAKEAVAAAGLDVEQVTVYEPPAPVVPRAAQAAAAIALAALVIAVGLALARAQVATLKRYLGALLAIGIAPAWPRRVLLTQQTVTLGLGTALALLVAVPPVIVAAWRVPDVVLSVPWRLLAAVIAVVYGSATVVTIVAARSLRPYA